MTSNDQLPLIQDSYSINPTNPNPNSNPSKRKRSLPGTPDPDAEVIALSPNSLMATNRFICEICNKGFKRDQNLQLHRRGHNLPWKLKQRNSNEVLRKKVYICPETTCVHHDSSRALGDLTGIKKHYSRKHGEKKWKCDKCSKKYAVMSDWKAHAKICGTREYKCDCGTLFSRKDSFITHRAFCDALVEESARFAAPIPSTNLTNHQMMNHVGGLSTIQNGGNMSFSGVFGQEFGGLESSENQLNLEWQQKSRFPLWLDNANNAQLNGGGGIGIHPSSSSSSRANFLMTEELAQLASQNHQWVSRGQEESFVGGVLKEEDEGEENKRINLSDSISSSLYYSHIPQQTNSPAPMSATALLQKAAQIGSLNSFSRSRNNIDDNNNLGKDQNSSLSLTQSKNLEGESSLTRDFLGVGGKENRDSFFASMSSAMEMRRYSRNDE